MSSLTAVDRMAAASETAGAFGNRLALLRRLRGLGPGLLTALVTLTVLESVVPAASAVAFAALVGGVHDATAALVAAATAPLVVYLAVLLAGHAVEALREPLEYLAVARLDGAHRESLARLAATATTVGGLERPEVQALIREARADPETFMEGTPGPGILAQLQLIGRVLAMLGAGAVLAAYAWWLVPLIVVPAAVVHRYDEREAREWRRVWRGSVGPSRRAAVWSDAIVSPGEGKEIRIFGLADWALGRIRAHLDAAYGPMWAVGRWALAVRWRPFLLMAGPLTVAYTVVAFGAAGGAAPVGVAAAVFAAATSVYRALADPAAHQTESATACLGAFADLRAALDEADALAPAHRGPAGTADRAPAASADRALAVTAPVDRTPAVGSPGGGPPLIRLHDVSFTYPGTDRTVLDHLDLDIHPGELLAVAGLNGAGKSTLIKLLSRLYEPTAGRITADGTDVSAMHPDDWRRHLSVVFQDFVRYHLSAADNIALGNAAVPRDDDALAAAVHDSGADEVIARLPAGLDTPLARTRTGGVDLSGGQWQRIVLARALYAVRTGATVLVLDEPTAHLDVKTEFEVFARLAAHRGDATVVLISHRLSTVRQADRIVLLDGGRVAESGPHDALMAAGGRYADMFNLQAARFRRGHDDRTDEGDLA